ncbi:MAG: glutaminase [Pseudomonadota bacterium]
MQALLEQIAKDVRPLANSGRVAQYIPALAAVSPAKFGIALVQADGTEFTFGDAEEPFSIQSISKLFALSLAMEWLGDGLWDKVGREPSGMRFNSLIQLETESGRPRNPFINAGAIATTGALMEHRSDYEAAFLGELRALSGNPGISRDTQVHSSEIATGDLNRAMAFVLKAHGTLSGDPIEVTDTYFASCSIAMSALDLARAAMFLVCPQEGKAICRSGTHARRVRAIMRTCGMYDQSGEFAYRVGMPGKSGVGGGIIVVHPGAFAACVWSPPLDAYGNSVAGQAALEKVSLQLL